MAWFPCTSFCKVVPRVEPEVGVVLCPVQGSWGMGFQEVFSHPIHFLSLQEIQGKTLGNA